VVAINAKQARPFGAKSLHRAIEMERLAAVWNKLKTMERP
jgi:hypothetical protein